MRPDVEVKRSLREPDDLPARRGAPCPGEQLRVAGRIWAPEGPGGDGRPVVPPSEAMRNLRRADVPRKLERWQPPWRAW